MAQTLSPDLCVIGAGSAGLSVAAGASQMGASVVLIEAEKMGGECLNSGCVPSKALLAAAHAAEGVRKARRFGIEAAPAAADAQGVFAHVHGAIAEIAPQDSVARYEGFGVRVIAARARFTGPRSVEAGGYCIEARRFVIATGSKPALPPLEGLERVPYLTNESVFEARTIPRHLLVIGGGPVGVEMSQAFARLGSKVTVVQSSRLLKKDDPELVRQLAARLEVEGVAFREQVRAVRVSAREGAIALEIDGGRGRETLEGSHLLIAVGRAPNLGGLDLEAAGVAYDGNGVVVDRGLRTSNRRIFALGDAAGPHRFTHMASYQAGVVLKRALFRLPAKVDYAAVPWVTYTDPELAHVGLSAEEAEKRFRRIRILRWPFAENDRAVTEGETGGLVKAVVSARSRVLGASILGARAGEMISLWGLATSRRMSVAALANLVVPYPTLSEVSKRAAASFYTPTLFAPRTQRLVRFLARFG